MILVSAHCYEHLKTNSIFRGPDIYGGSKLTKPSTENSRNPTADLRLQTQMTFNIAKNELSLTLHVRGEWLKEVLLHHAAPVQIANPPPNYAGGA